jgi:hypothetical protein
MNQEVTVESVLPVLDTFLLIRLFYRNLKTKSKWMKWVRMWRCQRQVL